MMDKSTRDGLTDDQCRAWITENDLAIYESSPWSIAELALRAGYTMGAASKAEEPAADRPRPIVPQPKCIARSGRPALSARLTAAEAALVGLVAAIDGMKGSRDIRGDEPLRRFNAALDAARTASLATPPAATPPAGDAELIARLRDRYRYWVAPDRLDAADRLTALAAQRRINARDGKWLDPIGCCKVCDGEIPNGHTDYCEIWKLEQQVAALTRERDSSRALVHNICEEWDEACDCTHDAAWGHGADCKATEIAAAKRALRERAESAEARCAAMERALKAADTMRNAWITTTHGFIPYPVSIYDAARAATRKPTEGSGE
jgi:hypothetical protein